MSGASLELQKDSSVLLIVDIQEKLAAVMPAEEMAQVVRNTNILLEAARRMDIPVVASVQYPKGLGPTVAGLSQGLEAIEGLREIEKIHFSVCGCADFGPIADELKAQGRTHWIVAGMESHICVYQSARGLLERGEQVHVVADAVISRAEHNYNIGLGLAERAGAFITSTETVVMDLLVRAQGDDFKAISRLIR